MAEAKAKKKVKAEKPEWLMVNFKATPKEKRAMVALAKKHANGNLSLWLRLSGTGKAA